jgi:septation ring formation regulator EzrA
MALSDDILKVKKQLESLKKSLDDVSKKQVDAIVDSFTKGGKSLKEWKEQLENFRDIADQTSDSLSFISQSFTDSVNELQKQNKSQKSIGELAKGLGMSASRATEMRQDFAYIANSSMDANVSVKGLQEAQLAVGQALGTNAQLNESDLKTLTKITKQTGLQHDELIGIEKLSLATR